MKNLSRFINPQLVEKSTKNEKLQALLTRHYGLQLLASLAFVSVEKTTLKLVAISPAHATRLRFQSRDMLKMLQKKQWPIDQVKVSSVPFIKQVAAHRTSAHQHPQQKSKKPRLSPQTQALLNSFAAGCEDNPELARSLKRLAKSKRKSESH